MGKILSDVTVPPGFYVGNWQDQSAATGCTVIVCPAGACGGVDVRGGAPATRETDLLRPEATVDVVHAVVLSGGSAYGLAASAGVADELECHAIGFSVGEVRVPIVCSACLYDLAVGSSSVRPDYVAGRTAALRALDEPASLCESGNVGAGCGCSIGKLAGMDHAMKGGLGWGEMRSGSAHFSAVAAVNACGNIVDPITGAHLAGFRPEASERAVARRDILLQAITHMPFNTSLSNTTISCIMTNVSLTKVQATKVAQMAADAYAHTILPTHTTCDGDAIFVLSCGKEEVPLDFAGLLATHALEQAIVNGGLSAYDAYGLFGAAGKDEH